MSYAVIRKLLETRLNTASPAIGTAFENVPYPVVKGTPWQRVNLLPAKTENPTMGDQFKRETGIFQVTVFYPLMEGPGNALARIELLRALFPRGLTLTQGNVRVLIDESPFMAAGVVDDGWYAIPLSVPYIADVS